MGAETGIQWTDATWNPVRGCSRISPGCENCYAETMAARFSEPGQWAHGFALRSPARWTRKVELVPSMLDLPLRWQKPRRIFVNSMSDLFHEALSNEDIAQVFAVMMAAPQHTFQVLTKRAARLPEWFAWRGKRNVPTTVPIWPLPNVWLGVSVEDQQRAGERIPHLLQTPAAVRFLSCEPLLGPVSLRWLPAFPENAPYIAQKPGGSTNHLDGLRRINWVIVGGESGAGARPMALDWARTIVEQCRDAGTACFVKQLGAWEQDDPTAPASIAAFHGRGGHDKGGDPQHWPGGAAAWPREFPR